MARNKRDIAEGGDPFVFTVAPPSPKPSTSMPEISKTPKVRHSGHLVDQKLKYTSVPPLLDKLFPETRVGVEEYRVQSVGIHLTSAEDRLFQALTRLLRDTSSNSSDAKAENFYSGNLGTELVPFGRGPDGSVLDAKSATIRVTRAEIYKAYLGRSDYSGKDILDIDRTMEGLCAKRFLMVYDRKYSRTIGGKEKKFTDRLEGVECLISVKSYTPGLTDDEIVRLDGGDTTVRAARGELLIRFHPITTDQIGSKWVEYPEDINQRTIAAAGGPNRVTHGINNFRDYLLREQSTGRRTSQLNHDSLLKILDLTARAAAGRRKVVRQKIEEAFAAMVRLGLLLEVKEAVGALGQPKYVFTINLDFG